LFVLWEGGGNVPVQLALANGLVERGNQVRVLTDAAARRGLDELEALASG
jgi:hypothetical protein